MLDQITDVPPGIQALDTVGTVTADDYERVFAPIVRGARQAAHRMRLLYRFGPDFKRLTLGALWADTRLGMSYLHVLDGCAVVTDIGWIRTPTRRIGARMPCPVRVYGNHEYEEAVAWLSSLTEGAEVSALDVGKAYIGGVSAALGSLGEFAYSGALARSRISRR